MKLIVSAVICAVMFALGFQAAGAQNTAKTQAKLNTAPQFFARLPRFSFPLGQSTCADKQFSKIKNLVLVRSNSPDVPEDLEGPAGGEELAPNVTHFVLAVTCDPASKIETNKVQGPVQKPSAPRIVQPATSSAST